MKTLHGTQRDYYEHLQNFIEFCRAQESTEWDRAYLEATTREQTIQQTQMMCNGLHNIRSSYRKNPHAMKMKTLHGTRQGYYEHLQHFIEFIRAQESQEWDRAYLEGLTMKDGGRAVSKQIKRTQIKRFQNPRESSRKDWMVQRIH